LTCYQNSACCSSLQRVKKLEKLLALSLVRCLLRKADFAQKGRRFANVLPLAAVLVDAKDAVVKALARQVCEDSRQFAPFCGL